MDPPTAQEALVAGSLNPIESRFVKPYYLKMMGLNALHLADHLWATLIETGRGVSAADVRWMLGTGHWRPVVMGAWFSLAVPAERIADDLLIAMTESKGSLTAPPLAVAAALGAGRAAVPAMINFINFNMEPTRRDGSESIVAAAIEHLGAGPHMVPSDSARQSFNDLWDVGSRLRNAWRNNDGSHAAS